MSFFRRASREKKERKISVVDVTTIRSVSGSKPGGSSPLGSFNAPTEVVQATKAYMAQRPGEMSFNQGDFFHVIGRGTSDYIEIQDPIKGIKGMAPASAFKFFEKSHRTMGTRSNSVATTGSSKSSHSGLHSIRRPSATSSQSQGSEAAQRRVSSSGSVRHVAPLPSLYGVVLYDFKAERPDELSVNAGDSIILCAHHDYEWFIGKFLNKVGEPGLIPVSYVQLYDVNTKVPYTESAKVIIQSVNLPTVDQWKAIKNKHKASVRQVGPIVSPELGRSVSDSSGSATNISDLYATDVNIESFSSTNGKYWYLVRVVLSDGTTRCLYRYYEDFFNFHQKVLNVWPQEGGKYDSKERIIPFIPGPVMDVSESLCHRRMLDLDVYLRSLKDLPDYISKSVLVNSFYDLLDGDQQVYSDGSQNASIHPERPPPSMIILNTSNQDQQDKPEHHQSTPQAYYPRTSDGSFERNAPERSVSAPIRRSSQLQRDRASQYSRQNSIANRMSGMTLNGTSTNTAASENHNTQTTTSSNSSFAIKKSSHSTSSSIRQSTPASVGESTNKFKLKFYYKEDIFAIAVPDNITYQKLKKLVIPRTDECNDTDIDTRLKIIPKDVNNVDQFEYIDEDVIRSDDQLWKSANFKDKGKFLVIV